MRTVHLVCNAHLDPVWLWRWEEGAAEALATFRTAADFCEEYDGFVFNHNEALLYQWVESYEPALFLRIRELVRNGRWHIMGGWFLQPDCNMPCGESFVRQILWGRRYFREAFGVEPSTAFNVDSFGHSRGLVQILQKAGFNSYVFSRPFDDQLDLPSDDFTWTGYDGSEVVAHRAYRSYLTPRGQVREKIVSWLKAYPEKTTGLILWGIGDHGGGPSREDLDQIDELKRTEGTTRITHSTPESYFVELLDGAGLPPRFDRDLRPFAVGCYTSQMRIKRAHRRLESALFATEKLVSWASAQRFMEYPNTELKEASYDLLFSQFHDVLAGTSVPDVEDDALRTMNHGLEILSRITLRAALSLSGGQSVPKEGSVTLLVFNQHPFTVTTVIDTEFQLPDPHFGTDAVLPVVSQNGQPIASQVEREACTLPMTWRKRVVFAAELPAGSVARYDIEPVAVPAAGKPITLGHANRVAVRTGDLLVEISRRTGLLDRYIAEDVQILEPGSCQPLVLADTADPWGMNVDRFQEVVGRFRLLTARQSALFASIHSTTLAPVRVIEDGEVRTVVEALMGYHNSTVRLLYCIPKKGTRVEIGVTVYWNEKDRMLKLSFPLAFTKIRCVAEAPYGIAPIPMDGRESVIQKWVAVVDDDIPAMFACINDSIYGCDVTGKELRLSLLRSAAYAAHPSSGGVVALPMDRFVPRQDQGVHRFLFWIVGGRPQNLNSRIDRDATIMHEPPVVLPARPAGHGSKPYPLVVVDGGTIRMSCCKLSEDGDAYILRFFEPCGQASCSTIRIPLIRESLTVEFRPFEIRTFRLSVEAKSIVECELLENTIRAQ